VLDSTALIILCGGYLTLWDIAVSVYVNISGLPAMAMNIALDRPRNCVAVAIDEMIFLYDLKLHETLPSQQKPPQEALPSPNRQTTGKPFIPSELSEFDITNRVMKLKSQTLDGLYFNIYRGVLDFDKSRIFQHLVMIKSLRSQATSLNLPSKIQEKTRKDFNDVRIFKLSIHGTTYISTSSSLSV
jgi:hypothetical protein